MKSALRHLVACLLLAIVTASARAESVHGTVRDSVGRAIAGADVTITSGGKTVRMKTAADGTFSDDDVLPPATIRAESIGFAPATVTWEDAASTIALTLRPASVAEQVVVTATRAATPIGNIGTPVTSISGRELAVMPELRIDSVLRQVPGFSLFRRSDSRTANPTSQGVSLRGLGASGASRALVLLDGIPLNDPFGGWVYWDRVPEQEVNSVEVLRGGGSALYGSGALAGVVNFRRASTTARNLSVNLSAGNQGTYSGDLAASEQLGKWSLSAAVQTLATRGYVPVPHELRGAADADANVRYATSWMRVARRVEAGSVFVGGDLFNESRQNGTVLQTNSTRLGEGFAGGDLRGFGGTFAFRVYGTAQHYNQTFSSLSADRNTESLVRAQAVPAQQTGASVQWIRPISMHNVLVIGGDVHAIRGHTDEVLWAQSVARSNVLAGGRQVFGGAFAEDILQLGSRVNLTAVIRGDGWRNYGASSRTLPLIAGVAGTDLRLAERSAAALSPSLGAAVRITNSVSVTGAAYGAFRTPTLNELYRAFRLGDVQTLANDTLRAERLRGAEGGINFGRGPVLVRATFFYNTIHDAIGNRTLQVAPDLITRQRQNLGSLDARGIELELQANLAERIWTRVSYTHVNSTVANTLETALHGKRIPQVPRNAMSAAIGYSGGRWSGTVVGRYVGLQYDDDLNQFPLPAYFTADTFVQYRVRAGLDAYLACENLLDRSYVTARTPLPLRGSGALVRAGLKLRLPFSR